MTELSILIIEDDIIYGNFLKEKLDNNESKIALTDSAEKGSALISSMKPDIIFLDNLLPKVNGIDAIGLFKEMSPDSIIILMSSTILIKDVAIATQNGADYIIDKSKNSENEFTRIVKAVKDSKKKKGRFWRFMDLINKKEDPKGRRSIAVLEDDELFSFHLSWSLEQTGNNHLVYTFTKASEFYDFCDFSFPDLLFLDYSLPDQNGDEVLTFVKENNPSTKVVVISANEDSETALDLTSMGIESYIVKNENWKENLKKLMIKLDL